MPAQHFVPSFANAIHASSRTQANALRALALSGEEPKESEWRTTAAAAILVGANWAGETCTPADIAKATGVPEQAVAKQFAAMADRLKGMAPR